MIMTFTNFPRYVEETWFNFEKTLKQLTQMSLHNQRIMGVLLEDCDIPDSLGELYFLDSSDPDFFHVFTKRLKTSEWEQRGIDYNRLRLSLFAVEDNDLKMLYNTLALMILFVRNS